MEVSKKRSNFALLLRENPEANGDSLAQLVEHNTFNVGVVGSSPTRITKKSGLPPQNAENHLISSVFLFVLSGRILRFSEHKRE